MELPHVEPAQESLEQPTHVVVELRASRRRLALDADAERRQIERDLHHGLQQHLVALAVEVQLARLAVDGDPGSVAIRLDELRESVREAIEEAERLAHRIQPPRLDEGGLGAALRQSAVNAGVRATIDLGDARECQPEIASTVHSCWLAVLERAHAGTEATISVRAAEDAFAFEIVAPTDSPPVARDAVVRRMRDRVEALDGELAASTEPGGLLRVTGSLPRSG